MKKLRILVADDHEVMREGVRAVIEQQPGWEICAMAATGREAVKLAKECRPDVVVLDLTMPELGGVEAVQQIKRALPHTEVLAFSGHYSEEIVAQVFEAGAKSYIRKVDAARDLVTAITSLSEHRPFFTADISEILFARFLPGDNGKKHPSGAQKLTARENQIVRFLAEGKSNKEIANTLGISVRTAEIHRATLMRKLRLDSVAAVVRYAIRNHIIEA